MSAVVWRVVKEHLVLRTAAQAYSDGKNYMVSEGWLTPTPVPCEYQGSVDGEDVVTLRIWCDSSDMQWHATLLPLTMGDDPHEAMEWLERLHWARIEEDARERLRPRSCPRCGRHSDHPDCHCWDPDA